MPLRCAIGDRIAGITGIDCRLVSIFPNSGRTLCIGSGCYDWYGKGVDASADYYHYNVELGNRIIEWHRVTYKADLWLIVHREAMLITRLEVCGLSNNDEKYDLTYSIYRTDSFDDCLQ